NVPTSKFLFAVVAATGLWTALIFGSFFQLGNVQWLQHNLSSWLLIPLGLCVMLLLNNIMTKTLLRDTYDTAR
ncbi:DedA family protein, partial [Vibrio sp. M260118]